MDLLKHIQTYIKQHEDEFIQIREYLHAHPEVSWQEYETSKYIKQKLDEWGVPYTEMAGTGVVADLVGNPDGKRVAYRGDIDALPMEDEKKCEYKSQNSGVCHSCGHDFHTATVLATLKTLLPIKDALNGTIRFIFQPAEEVTPGGARKMVSEGVLKGISEIVAMHSEPALPLGDIGVVRGWVTTQSVTYKIHLKGKGGHSARPYIAKDPIFAGTLITQQLYAALERKNRYDQFFVFSMTTFHSGTVANIIPDEAILQGSLRLTDPHRLDEIKSYIDDVIRSQCKLLEIDVEIEHIIGDPPVINDTELAERVHTHLVPIFGEPHIFKDTRTMGGEDFSNYQKHIPGCYIRFGIGQGQPSEYSLHSPKFDIDKGCVPKATEMFSWLLIQLLNDD